MMYFFRYIKEKKVTLIFIIILMFFINVIIITSSPLEKAGSDILYLNITSLFIITGYILVDYYVWVKSYRDIYEYLKHKRFDMINTIKPYGNKLEMDIIKTIIEYKDEQLNDSIKTYQDALTEGNEYVTKWVHEIKIPLTVCQLIADELEEYDKNIPAKAQDLRYELDRIRYYIQQILYTSRANSYCEDLKIEEVGLEKVLGQVIKNNKNLFIKKGININLNLNEVTVLTDKKWISYIIEQVLVNSCKYSKQNGVIDIWSDDKENSIRLNIKDYGIGIKSSDISRVFDKGFTGTNGRKMTKSTGMGLHIANKMANMLHHQINIESEENKYTQVTITFNRISE